MDDKMVFLAKDILNPNFPFKIYRQIGIGMQPYHCHDYIQMWYVVEGECIHNFNGSAYRLSRGNVFVLPPGVFHSMQAKNQDSVLIGLEFSAKFINEEINENNRSDLFDYAYLNPFVVSLEEVKPLFPLAGSVSKVIEMLLEETLFEYTKKAPHYTLFIKANILKILALIAREYDNGVDKKKKSLVDRYKTTIYNVLEYVDSHYAEKIYLEEMCHMTMLSPSYFSDVFKQVTGRTFTEYVTHIRIEKSKELLLQKDKNISGVAFAVGFSDNAHFDKMFKKEIGITPLQYRKNLQLLS
ncbi:MAG: AraC family transcriptional regulator [Oscillospiraceae bacterium]